MCVFVSLSSVLVIVKSFNWGASAMLDISESTNYYTFGQIKTTCAIAQGSILMWTSPTSALVGSVILKGIGPQEH